MNNLEKLEIRAVETDADKALRYKRRIEEALTPLLQIMSEAHKERFVISWNAGPDQFGNIRLNSFSIVKSLL